ncbi:MAG: hypothetical protein ACM3UV_05795 [Nocardioidaceae bacterium]
MTLPNRTTNMCAETGSPVLTRELRRLGFPAAPGEPYAPIQRRVAALSARVCGPAAPSPRACAAAPPAAPRD